MSNAFGRSWEITKLSFSVINKDKELLLFPVLSIIFSILFIAAMIVPAIVLPIIRGRAEIVVLANLPILFLTYLGLAFIATFFNVAVVYTTKKRFEGGNATFSESLGFAFSKVHLILYWSLLAATVGIILRSIESSARRAGKAGEIIASIITSIIGIVWSIVTIFVVPGMVYYDLGPIDAIKKSVKVLKRTWGESLIRYFGLGIVEGYLIFPAIILIFVSIFLGKSAMIILIPISVLYTILVSLVFGIANSVFNTALFVYADTGKVPMGYRRDMMKNAFRPKKRSGFFDRQ